MKIAFCTNISEEYYHSMGCDKLVKSAKYFHPDIPFHLLDTQGLMAKYDAPMGILMAYALHDVFGQYDAVIRFDADSILVGKLDELIEALEDGFDIIGVRNNNDYNKAGKDNPIVQPGAGTEHYLNAGLVATTSRDFVAEWISDCRKYASMLPFGEQTVLNALSPKYKTFIVDQAHARCYYGISALSGEDTHWDSWKNIWVSNKGELFLSHKEVKVLHHGGGSFKDKLGFYMFNKETRQRLIEITA